MPDVLLVEDTPSDASLAGIAIALRHPRVRVHDAPGLVDALRFLEAHDKPVVVILGWRALKEVSAPLRGTFVGFASDVGELNRERALAAGVLAIYDRPVQWREFCDALEKLLERHLRVHQTGSLDVKGKP